MKALKEKRVSLRSLIRRGLVILSLFALVFASCSDSDNGGGTDPTGGGTIPTSGPTIRSVTILAQPTKESFQGYKPDLTNLAIEVEESTGNRYYAYFNDTPGDFSTVPEYLDTAFPNPGVAGNSATYGQGSAIYQGQTGQLQLVYKGQPVQTNTPLRVPMVVSADFLESTIEPGRIVDWYSDTRPDFTGITFNVIFDTGWEGLGGNSIAGVPNQIKKLPIVSNAAFPLVNYKDAAKDKKITIYVGPPGGSKSRANPNNKVETLVPINYYGVAGLRVADANWVAYADDDIDVFYTNYSIDATKVFDAFMKSAVKFEITYDDPAKTKKVISTEQYIANNRWYYNLSTAGQGISSVSMLQDLIVTNDGVAWPKRNMTLTGWGAASLTQGQSSVLWYGQDEDNEEAWRVRVAYMPWNFTKSADYTQTDVAIPLYMFEEIRAESTTPGMNMTMEGNDNPAAMNDEQLRSIKGKWRLVGVYMSGQKRLEKDIVLTNSIFYAGYYGASMAQGGNQSGWAGLDGRFGGNISVPGSGQVTQWHLNISAAGYQSLGTRNNVTGLTVTGQVRRDYILPVWYRGQMITDDEGIVVDLIKK